MNNSPDVKDGEEYDVKDTAGLKEAGNRAFAEGDLEQAYTVRGHCGTERCIPCVYLRSCNEHPYC